MKMRHLLASWLWVVLLSSSFLSAVVAEQEYKTVSAMELRSNPQNYWARGVLFNDVMTAWPGGNPLKFEGRTFTPVNLKVAGTCYVEPALLPVIKELPLNQTYLFKGTVLQAKLPGSWFFSSKKYLIIINGVEATIDTDKMSSNFQTMYNRLDQTPPKGSTQAMTSLLLEIQTALSKYAKEKNVEVADLLKDDSEAAKKAIGIIYEAISTQETKSKTTATEILASYILAFLRAQYQPEPAPVGNPPAPVTAAPNTNTPAAPASKDSLQPAATNTTPVEPTKEKPQPTPAVTPATPAPAVETNTPNVAATNEPPKTSWLQNWRERRAQKAAEEAEQDRIEKEKKLQREKEALAKQEEERKAREELKKKQMAEREEQDRLAAEAKEAKRKAAAAKKEEERKAREEARKRKETEKAEQARLAAEKKALEEQKKAAAEAKQEEAPTTLSPAPEASATTDDLSAPVGM
jgi:hypothetical protein